MIRRESAASGSAPRVFARVLLLGGGLAVFIRRKLFQY
jgi:hypothetical protein